jgi:hypothetical protein
MKCPACRALVVEDAQFCTSCGSALHAVNTSSTARLYQPAGGLYCPACDTSNAPATLFCKQCGTGLAKAARALTQPAEDLAVATAYADATVPTSAYFSARAPERRRRSRGAPDGFGVAPLLDGGLRARRSSIGPRSAIQLGLLLIGITVLVLAGPWWPAFLLLIGVLVIVGGILTKSR